MPIKTTPKNLTSANPVMATDDLEPEIECPEDYLTPELVSGRTLEKKQMGQLDLNQLSAVIRQAAGVAVKQARDALCFGKLAVINAWTCGCALNVAKQKVGHGHFEKWFEEGFSKSIWGDPPFSLRNAQRYMKVAKEFPTAEELIASHSSLRQAQQACRILPPPPQVEKKPVDGDREAVARARLLKGVTSVQSGLRRFTKQNIAIDDDTRKELLAAKAEIDRLFESLVGR